MPVDPYGTMGCIQSANVVFDYISFCQCKPVNPLTLRIFVLIIDYLWWIYIWKTSIYGDTVTCDQPTLSNHIECQGTVLYNIIAQQITHLLICTSQNYQDGTL